MYHFVKRNLSPSCLTSLSALALVLALMSTGCARASRAQRSFESGKRYFEQQKFAEAAIEFQKSLKRNPKSWEPRYYLALSEVKLGQLQDAYRNLTAIVDLQPSFVPAHLELADLFLLNGKTEEARQQVGAVQSLDPNDARAQAILARSYLLDKDFSRSVEEFEKAKQLAPRSALVWAQSGLAKIGTKQYGPAEKDFRRALELEPENPENYQNLANLLRITSRASEVEPILKHSVDTHPKSLEFSLVLADFYYREGRLNDINNLFAGLKSRAGDFPHLNQRLGDFWIWRNEVGWAAKEFEAEQATKPSLLVQKKLIGAYLTLGRIDDAERLNKELLNKEAYDIEGHAFEGALAYFHNHFNAATEELQMVLKEEPKSLLAKYYLGLSWMALQRPEQARSAFFDCVQLNEKFLQAYLRLGDLAVATKDWQSALEYANKAIEISPRLPDGHLLMAQAYMGRGDLAKAEPIIKAAEKVPNLSSQFHEIAAQFYTLKKDDAAASTQYEEALARTTQPLPTLVRYTDFLAERGHIPTAIERAKQWTAKNPQPDYYELLARLFMREQKFEEAEAACRKAVELDPRRGVSHFWLGETFRQRGRWQEALTQYDETIRLSPNQIPPYLFAGNLLIEQAQYEKAKLYFEKALKQEPGSTQAQYALARWYGDRSENLDLALSMAQELKKTLPQDPHASDLLGWIYYQKGVYRTALDQLRPAAGALPDDAVVQYHLGMTYAQIGETQKARQALRQALTHGLMPGPLASEAEQKLKQLS